MIQVEPLIDESRETRVSPASALGAGLVFLVTLATGAELLGRFMPPYLRNAHFRAALEHLEEQGERYDTLFIGPSRVNRHIAPKLFDALTAEAGVPTSSFNFGVGGMQGLEVEFVLRQVLAMGLPRLRWVWIEPGDPAHRTDAVNRKSERFTAWHDLDHTWRALELLLDGERPGYDWPSWLREHLPAMARRELQVGRARYRLRPRPFEVQRVLGPSLDGYRALDWDDSSRRREARTRFLDNLERYRERREQLASSAGHFDRELELFERRFLLRLREAVEAAGAQPIFLVGPALTNKGEYLVRAAAEGLVPVTFNYADPIRYPEFYDVDSRFDRGHLNHEGAKLYTRRLALDFVRYVGGLHPSEGMLTRNRGPRDALAGSELEVDEGPSVGQHEGQGAEQG